MSGIWSDCCGRFYQGKNIVDTMLYIGTYNYNNIIIQFTTQRLGT